jgi:thiosulfate reductase cytochrome b subunit
MSISHNSDKESAAAENVLSSGHTKQRMSGWTPLRSSIAAETPDAAALMAEDVLYKPATSVAAKGRPEGNEDESSVMTPLPRKRMNGYSETNNPGPAQRSDSTGQDAAIEQTSKRAEESQRASEDSVSSGAAVSEQPSSKRRMAGYMSMNSLHQNLLEVEGSSSGTGKPETGFPAPALTPAPASKQRLGAKVDGGGPSASSPAAVRQRLGRQPVDSQFTEDSRVGPAPDQSLVSGEDAAHTPSPVVTGGVRATASGQRQKSKMERRAWVRPVQVVAGLLAASLIVVLSARWLFTLSGVQDFISTYPGHPSTPDSTPVGIPAWMGWQHYFNIFFIVLIARSGLQIRLERRPPGHWMPKRDSIFSPRGNTPKRVSLSQWLHQTLDVLWVLNGILFILLLFVTGHWMRIVPTSWDVFPNMLSAALQYASLNWPTENGWIHYNALQLMAYFVTVFIAAPLAVVSGVRLSTWWPEKAVKLTKAYPVEWARAVHLPVMIYFMAFTLVHVLLVFLTGTLRNLNHMYGSRDAVDAWGLVIFLASLLVIAAGWFLTKPLFITPIASRTGTVSK